MAVAWNQAGVATGAGTDISNSVAANNIAFGTTKVVKKLTVLLADSTPNDNGLLDSFGGTISWAIYSDNGGQPGTLLFSGTDNAPILTDTGTQSDAGGDILSAEIDIGGLALGRGNYWVAIHEGVWGSAGDGSAVEWARSAFTVGGGAAAGTPVTGPSSWVAGGHDGAFTLAGDAVWNQDSPSTAGGANISTNMVANDFTLTTRTPLIGATIYLTDGVINDNGLLDSLGTELAWGIYAKVNGKPGNTNFATGGRVTITDTGLQSASGADIMRVDFSFSGQNTYNIELAAGEYYLVLREGGSLAGSYDGSPVYWNYDLTASGTEAMALLSVSGQNVWTPTGSDTSFQIWSASVAVGWDPATTVNEDQSVLVDVLANDWINVDDFVITATAVTGTAVIDDNGTPGDPSDDRVRYTPPPNYNGNAGFSYTLTSGNVSSTATVSVTVKAVNDAPTVTRLAGDVAVWNQGDGDVRVDIGSNAVLADIDSPNFGGGFLLMTVTGGASGEDRLYFANDERVKQIGADLYVDGLNIGSVVGTGANISFGLSNKCTPELLSFALKYLTYANLRGADPTQGVHTINYTLIDGDLTANGGNDTLTWTSAINVTALDDLGIANADTRTLNEGQMVNIAVLANDSTANGALQVAKINGTALIAGQSIELPSGGIVTLLANGKLVYDANDAFTWLSSASTAAASGTTSSYVDKFTYTLADGSSALVSVTVNGFDNGDGRLHGAAGNDNLTGTTGDDTFLLQAGGTDRATGGAGDDTFYFGAAFNPGDTVNGGAGTDTLMLQGNYGREGASLTIGAGMLDGIELLVVMSGTNTSFGTEAGYNRYYLKLADAALAAGTMLTVQASKLGAFESLKFDGSAETNASFRLFGGGRDDVLIGGVQADWIFGGGGHNHLTGGGGADTFVFRPTGYLIWDDISDLSRQDKIDLSALDANTNTAQDDAFTFIGTAAFTGVAGQLHLVFDYTFYEWKIEGDMDGDGHEDLIITGFSDVMRTAADFSAVLIL